MQRQQIGVAGDNLVAAPSAPTEVPHVQPNWPVARNPALMTLENAALQVNCPGYHARFATTRESTPLRLRGNGVLKPIR